MRNQTFQQVDSSALLVREVLGTSILNTAIVATARVYGGAMQRRKVRAPGAWSFASWLRRVLFFALCSVLTNH